MEREMKIIHESEYGESPLNFHVEKYKDELHVDLTYPPYTDADNSNEQCRYICINQESVRASDGVRLHYDYERDGFAVEQPQRRLIRTGPDSFEEADDWIEVGFFQSWKFDPCEANGIGGMAARGTEEG
jgi:hypothetical protein